MNSSGVLLRASVINSETKEANQTKRVCLIGRQRDIHKDNIVNILGFYQIENERKIIFGCGVS